MALGRGRLVWGQKVWAHRGRKPPRGPAPATRPVPHSLGLVVASLEEGEEPTHVESRRSEAV